MKALALLCLVFFTTMAFGVWLGKIPPIEEGTPVEYGLVGSAAAVLLCIAWAAYAFTAYVTISDRSIEWGSIFGRKSLPADKILTWIEYDGRDCEFNKIRYLKVISTDPHFPSIRLRKSYYAFDGEFYEWLRGINQLSGPGPSGSSSGVF